MMHKNFKNKGTILSFKHKNVLNLFPKSEIIYSQVQLNRIVQTFIMIIFLKIHKFPSY